MRPCRPAATVLVVTVLVAACRATGAVRAERPRPPPLPWAALVEEPDGPPGVWSELAGAPARLFGDARRVVTRPSSWLLMAAATLFHAFNETYDEREVEFFRRHSIYGRSGRDYFEKLGNGFTLYGGALAWYLTARAFGNEGGRQGAKTLMSALALTSLSTLALKGAFNDARPNGGRYDFPSGHSSMSMAAAATLDGLYGHAAGYPAYVLAVLVGLQRLDTLSHDTGSVVFGWTLGYVVGHALTTGREPRVLGMIPALIYDPDQEGWAIALTGSLP